MSIAQQIVGTWTLVSSVDIDSSGTRTDTWGPNPLGTYMFDSNGRFAQILLRSDLPKVANREQTTAEQAKAVVLGSIAMFGTYAVDRNSHTITHRPVGAMSPDWIGSPMVRGYRFINPNRIELRVLTTGDRQRTATGSLMLWERVRW